MPGEKFGEPILLIWDGWPEGYYVKGHLSESEALAALNKEELLEKLGRNIKGDHQWYKPLLSSAINCYGRWSMEPGPDDCKQVLRTYPTPGRGRFPITAFDVLKWEKIDSPVYKP